MSSFLSFRDPDPPPCASADPVEMKRLAALFDSTLKADHHEARKLCDDCPFIIACDDHHETVKRDMVWGKPEGTWASRLHGYPAGRPGRPRKATA